MRRLPPLALLLASLALIAPGLVAVDGITDTEIVLGQCAALTGPASGLGQGMNQGITACIAETNAAGGVMGRKLRLVTADDGYDPDRCVDGTQRLIEQDKVFALVGFVGTPTCKAALPVITQSKVPLVGLFTGAMVFRQPVQSYVFNVRASYDDETDVLVDRFVTDIGAKRIAVFYQNDAFGLAGLSGVEKALAKRSLILAGKGSFERNTQAVKAGLAAVIAAKPDAVVMVGPYRPVAVFVREARAAGLTAPLSTISFVGTENLIAELGDAAEGVIISQVVPSPDNPKVPVVGAYRAALKAVLPDAKASYVSLEGYLSARVLVAALGKVPAPPTREALVDVLNGLHEDLGGFTIGFSKDNHQASTQVHLTRVVGAKARVIASLNDKLSD
jgi:ABC-type branched-subunit amino acid transport system substrate-binding protein